MMQSFLRWVRSGPKYEVTIYFGIVYVYDVPILPLIDVRIRRIDQ